MSIFLWIVVLIGFLHFNNRLSAIEDKMGISTSSVKDRPEAEVPQPKKVEVAPAQSSSASGLNEERGGQLLGKMGILAVVVGVSFFLKYAFDNNLIDETGRVILGFVGGLLLVGLGQYLSKKYHTYSQVISGGGIAILYLTVYAAFAFYQLITQPVALIVLVLITALSAVLSHFTGTVTLAGIGVIGGFLTPFLLVANNHNLTDLFSYILVLNVGVLVVAFKQKWVELNYLSFAGTVLVFSSWFADKYTVEQFWPVMAYITSYFAVFLLAAILPFFKQLNNKDFFSAFIYLNGLGYFMAGYYLLNDAGYKDDLGLFTFSLALVYFLVGYGLQRLGKSKLSYAHFLGLATFFLTAAINIQFEGLWVVLAWLAEAAVLVTIGALLSREEVYPFGFTVFIAAVIKFFIDKSGADFTIGYFKPFANEYFLLLVIMVAVAYYFAYLFTKYPLDVLGSKSKNIVGVFLVVANILTVYAVTTDINQIYDNKILMAYESADQERPMISDRLYYPINDVYDGEVRGLLNERNTVISIFWALYSIVVMAVGFATRSYVLRIFGLVFFFITGAKVFVEVWSLGQIYRIVSSIVFGVIALIASFAYAKYRHRLGKIIS